MNQKNSKSLVRRATFDVAIIGCGSIGLATAYYLSRHDAAALMEQLEACNKGIF